MWDWGHAEESGRPKKLYMSTSGQTDEQPHCQGRDPEMSSSLTEVSKHTHFRNADTGTLLNVPQGSVVNFTPLASPKAPFSHVRPLKDGAIKANHTQSCWLRHWLFINESHPSSSEGVLIKNLTERFEPEQKGIFNLIISLLLHTQKLFAQFPL